MALTIYNSARLSLIRDEWFDKWYEKRGLKFFDRYDFQPSFWVFLTYKVNTLALSVSLDLSQNLGHFKQPYPGVCFSKTPKTFGPQKAICTNTNQMNHSSRLLF